MISDPKWANAPKSFNAAEKAVKRLSCPVCGSGFLLAILRRPDTTWRAHCNNCATELPIVVILNRDAWTIRCEVAPSLATKRKKIPAIE